MIGRQDEYLVNMQHTVIPSWYHRNGYVQSMATLIEKELAKFERPEEVGFQVNFSRIHRFQILLLLQVGDAGSFSVYKHDMEYVKPNVVCGDRCIYFSVLMAYQWPMWRKLGTRIRLKWRNV